MKKDSEILSSFDLKKGLNPKVWVKDNKSTKLKPEIREKLLEIAYEFIEFLGIDIIVSDVHMTGSMANYNWSKYSDFDLHVIVDFEQFPKEQLDLYKELFKLKKTLFNSDHNIKIYGYDVELYLQDSNEPHFSTGVYSVIYNKWLTPPKKGDFKADKEVLMSKVDQWTEKIDEVIDSAKGKDLEAALKLLGGFKDKLKKYRQSGLEGGGELSYENLVFKYLRRNGYIEKLFNFEKEKVDRELSLEQKLIGEQEKNKGKIRDFLSNLFSGKKNKEGEVKVDNPKKADIVSDDVSEFYKTLDSIQEPVSQQKRGEYSFQENVESIQIGLELLGYKLPNHGVDGLYGPETSGQVEKFKKENIEAVEKAESTDETDNQSKILPPLDGTLVVISKFGPRGGRPHNGVDLRSDRNTTIKSPADGKVVGSSFGVGKCGGYILIQHSDGYQTKYCHCNEIDVSKGDTVTQGQIIGKTGGCNGGKEGGCNGEKDEKSKKGNSTYPHLHFEVILNGVAVDPETIIDKKYIGKYNGEYLVNSVATPEMVKVLLGKLKEKNIQSEDIEPYIDKIENKPVKSKESTIGDKNQPTEKRKSKNYLVYKPDNFKGGEAHVLFAGLHSNQNGQISLNESFYGSGVDPIKGKVLVVITHWGTSVEEAIKHVKDNYNATVTSIAGFSKGGMKMWDYVGPRSNMKFVGLIDPSPEGQGQGESPYINLDFGSNTYMTCNWKNWGNKPPGYVPREVLKWYCTHKDDSNYKGKVICTDKDSYDHSEIFKNFYKEFANKI